MLAIMGYIRGRRVTPLTPEAFVASLPELDADGWDEEDDAEPDLEGVAGVGCVITYADSSGFESVRRVTCRKLSRKGVATYLQAFCHEREALRTFRVDRILEVACGATGEVFSPASDYFGNYQVEDGGAAINWGLGVQAAADLRAGLNVLAFLARCDGRVVEEERVVFGDFCQSFAVRFGSESFEYEAAGRHAEQLAPDAETFYVALLRLKRAGAPPGLARLALQSSGRLIDADGVHRDEEFYFGSKVQEYLAA